MNKATDHIVIPEFITPLEKRYLQRKALFFNNFDLLNENPSGKRRYNRKVHQWTERDLIIRQIGNRIKTKFSLHNCDIDPFLGWIMSVIVSEGGIHRHKDKTGHYQDTGLKHLRCNVMVSKPAPQGNPWINKKMCDVPELGLWAFFPSESIHGMPPLWEDSAPRIAFQFGFAVPESYDLDKVSAISADPRSSELATMAKIAVSWVFFNYRILVQEKIRSLFGKFSKTQA